ncbi:MAG: hypothetical protein ACYS6I_01660 [Planctomycetota bacterium]
MNRQKFAPGLVLFCIILATVYASYVTAAPRGQGTRGQGRQRGRQGRGRDASSQGRQPDEAQNEKREQALSNAAGAIDTTLVEMLNAVNAGWRPNTQKVAAAQETIQKSRKYIKQFQDNMVCQYFMLSAWADYFENDADNALNPATQAYRKDRTNNDAHATQAAMAVLAGQKPLVLRAERQTQRGQEPAGRTGRGASSGRQSRGRSRRQNTPTGRGGRGRTGPDAAYGGPGGPGGPGGAFSSSLSSGNILNLDTDSIKGDWLGQKIGQLKLNCLNGTTFAYNPAEVNLCILFWKLGAADADSDDYSDFVVRDPNNPSQILRRAAPVREPQQPTYEPPTSRRRRPGRPGGRFGGRMGARPGSFEDEAAVANDPVSVQMSALGKLFHSKFQNPDFKFVAVNTNHPQAAPAVVSKLLQSPWPWAQTMLDDSAAAALGTLDIQKVTADKPVLAIVDRTGTVRYAGPAAGFLAPMVADNLLSSAAVPSSKTYTAPPQAAEQIGQQIATIVGGQPSPQMLDPTPEGIEYTSPQPQLQPPQDSEITVEDFQAQKLLTYAQGLFIPAGRQKFLTSKMGVDLCRQIINEYPNTTYADEARKLLRTVPPHERKRYNITNEEMGL